MIKELMAKAAKKYVSRGLLVPALCLAMSTMALADWRSDMGVFRIGIAANYGEPFKPEQFEPFRSHISKALNMPVEIFQARDASALIDATASQRIEYAIMSAIGYATLEAMCACVTPLVAPVSQQGATSVRSALIVNPERIKSLDQLAGKTIALGPDTSLTGNLIPMNQFSVGGKNLSALGMKMIKTQNTEEAMLLFKNGEVDAFFGWQGAGADSDKIYSSLLGEHLVRFPQSAVATLWLSNPIRFGPHAVRKNLPREAVSALVQSLTNLESTAPLGYDAVVPDLAGGFKPVSAEDYRQAAALVRAIANVDMDATDEPPYVTTNN